MSDAKQPKKVSVSTQPNYIQRTDVESHQVKRKTENCTTHSLQVGVKSPQTDLNAVRKAHRHQLALKYKVGKGVEVKAENIMINNN
jgi:hypothetical protein